MIINDTFSQMLNNPVRALRGRVEVYEGSTLSRVCGCHDNLINFSIERVGDESKMGFGFGICQRLNTHLIDRNRELDISTANYLEVEFGTDAEYIYAFPNFYVTEVNRDETTNELSITAYDALHKASQHTFAEIGLIAPYTIMDVAEGCAYVLGVPLSIENVDDEIFNADYPTGANFEGTETLRDVLDDIAEATQTIYFINSNWELTFKRLDKDGEAVLTIDKEKYFTLDSKTNRRLVSVCHATELGDNVQASLETTGTTHYVRDNAFWELRDDISSVVENALTVMGGLTINQFSCKWRGNYLLEIADKIALTTKDNGIVTSYVINDVISFDGSLSQQTSWSYADNDEETPSNPSTLGEALKHTFAKVDKVNRQINMQVSSPVGDKVSELEINEAEITARVANIEETTSEQFNSIKEEQTVIKQTQDSIQITIDQISTSDASKVTTSTGFTLDNAGLNISSSENEANTQIAPNGMTVYKDSEQMLFAGVKENDNGDKTAGVFTKDLHAETYLIIGHTSRLEDFNGRTTCFWIG